jgi:3-oxoacyl-(acyl-carrier-protein) synthase
VARRVFITGLGIISSIGNTVEETLQSILTMKSGIGKITILETRHRDMIPVCEIRRSNDELFVMAGIGRKKGLTRTALLGMIAAREAVQSAGLTHCSDPSTGCISSTSVGGMDKTEQCYFDLVSGSSDMLAAASHDCGDSTERIAGFLGIDGFMSTISTACSGSANSIMLGAKLIRHGLLERAVVGGTDAMTRFTLNGFLSLMILSKEGCKPFDEKRDGITLGEGAAFLVLESGETVDRRKGDVICELRGYGNACDAFHQTATSPEGDGPFFAMSAALATSGVPAEEIDYINAHGTGTVNNDLSEGKAVERVFGNRIPPLSSTKGFTGHCLGASGAIEAVLSSLAIRHNMILPNLNFREKMKELGFSPSQTLLRQAGVDCVLSNSFGFGGNNTSLIFSRC